MTKTFNYRILLVDDNESLLEATAAILSSEGNTVNTARDGFEAIASLREGASLGWVLNPNASSLLWL